MGRRQPSPSLYVDGGSFNRIDSSLAVVVEGKRISSLSLFVSYKCDSDREREREPATPNRSQASHFIFVSGWV